MKARITYLKAPWPLGARVGDVVEFDKAPAWAAGKFQEVGDDEPVTLEFGETVLVELKGGDAPEVESLKATIADLTAKLDAQSVSHAEALEVSRVDQEAAEATIVGLREQAADLTAKLEAAQAKTGKK